MKRYPSNVCLVGRIILSWTVGTPSRVECSIPRVNHYRSNIYSICIDRRWKYSTKREQTTDNYNNSTWCFNFCSPPLKISFQRLCFWKITFHLESKLTNCRSLVANFCWIFQLPGMKRWEVVTNEIGERNSNNEMYNSDETTRFVMFGGRGVQRLNGLENIRSRVVVIPVTDAQSIRWNCICVFDC